MTSRVISALAGSSAVATFGFWNSTFGKPVWITLTLISAIFSTVSAVVTPEEKARKHATLRQRYTPLRVGLETLWQDAGADNGSNEARFRDALRVRRKERAEIESSEPAAVNWILRRAQNDVRMALGGSPDSSIDPITLKPPA
jgi:hypothetical protein